MECTHRTSEPAIEARSSRIDALVQPVRSGRRRLLITTRGLASVTIDDRFDEIVVDLHWLAILKWFIDEDGGDLHEFRDSEVAGHRLASSPQDVGTCFRWVAP